MNNFCTIDRQTGFLLPPSVDEWLPEKHLARFVVEVIDGMDLRAMSGVYRGSGPASYRSLQRGLALGYRRGKHGGSWLARTRDPVRDGYTETKIGPADDDGEKTVQGLNYDQAEQRAREIFALGYQARAGRARPRDRLQLIKLVPIRPRISTKMAAALAPQPRPERGHRHVVCNSGELFSRSLDLVVHDLSPFREGLGRG
jgi:hypothetical protein